MQTIIEAAKRIITKLNEIQPAVSMAGMDMETDIIREMKGDMVAMIGSVTPDHVALGRRLLSTRADTVSHAIALRDVLGWDADPAEMSDDQVLTAMFAAETFIQRARDYMGSKAQSYQGGQHAAA